MTVSYRTLGYVETAVRVRFGMVDRYGTLWHGHALTLFETARAELARPFGLGVSDLLTAGLAVPMVDLSCEFKTPATDDALLLVQSTLLQPDIPLPELVFRYRVLHESRDEVLNGRTRQVFVRQADGRAIVRLPVEIRERLERVWIQLAAQPTWPEITSDASETQNTQNPRK